MTKVFKYCYETDRLQKRIRRAKGNSSKKYRMRKALYRLYKRVRNLVDEVHKKLSKWLCENYRVVLLPKFDTQQMTRRAKRKINSTTARGMYTWAHYRFRQTLIHKAELYPSCTVIVCDERYTSMTCGACGRLHETLGSKKTFWCPHPDCDYVADRDISAARNILLRYLTLQKITGLTNSFGQTVAQHRLGGGYMRHDA